MKIHQALSIHLLAAIFSLQAAIINEAEACETVLIANSTSASHTIDDSQLKEIMLGKQRRWESSGAPVSIAMVRDTAVVDCFLEQKLGKSPSAFNNHWKRLVFTGKGSQPRQFDTEAEVIAFVASEDGAVGIVSSQTPAANVAVIVAP